VPAEERRPHCRLRQRQKVKLPQVRLRGEAL
jgi:hypothetical protein